MELWHRTGRSSGSSGIAGGTIDDLDVVSSSPSILASVIRCERSYRQPNRCCIRLVFRRVIWIVLDSVGIGEMPDAAAYGDTGSDTLGNIARRRPLHLPNLCRLGWATSSRWTGLPPAADPAGAFGRCALASPGKDTTTGHWEMAGIHLEKPFPLYPHGFPREIMDEFERRIGRAHARQQSRVGNRDHQGTGRGAHAHRIADRLHFGRQRVPGGRARRGDSALGAV